MYIDQISTIKYDCTTLNFIKVTMNFIPEFMALYMFLCCNIMGTFLSILRCKLIFLFISSASLTDHTCSKQIPEIGETSS